ncbi:MAG: hypothetical protein AAGD32_17055 [Planctomycetota bacterium]
MAVPTLALTSNASAQFTETDDAPISPLEALRPEGTGPLTTITGATFLFPFDPVDSYVINITDPDNFQATTASGIDPAASVDGFFDTRLFLFTLDGTPVLGNDDVAGVFQSAITAPENFPGTVASSATGVTLTPGEYVLSIGGFSDDPIDTDGTPLFGVDGFGFTADNDALFGADPNAGAFVQYESEAGTTGFEAQNYTIALTGVSFPVIPEPASLGLLAASGLLLCRRR